MSLSDGQVTEEEVYNELASEVLLDQNKTKDKVAKSVRFVSLILLDEVLEDSQNHEYHFSQGS